MKILYPCPGELGRTIKIHIEMQSIINLTSVFLPLFILTSCATINSPGYKSRIKALGKVTDQSVFCRMAMMDENPEVRISAIGKLTEEDCLVKVAVGKESPEENVEVKSKAIEKITSQDNLAKVAIESGSLRLCEQALEGITKQQEIFRVALRSGKPEITKAALNNLSDQSLLLRLVNESENRNIIRMAVEKINDQSILFQLFKEYDDIGIKELSFSKISDTALLVSGQQSLKRFIDMQVDPVLKVRAVSLINDRDFLFSMAIELLNDVNKSDYRTFLRTHYKPGQGYRKNETESFNLFETILNKLYDQEALKTIAEKLNDTYLLDLIIPKIQDQDLIYHLALSGRESVREAAWNKLESHRLAGLVDDYSDKSLKFKIIELLKDQKELISIAENNDNLELRKAAFRKLDDSSLELLSKKSGNQVLGLSAQIRSGRVSWSQAFHGSLKNVIGAAAMVDYPEPDKDDVLTACHEFIRKGDESRINELIYLLNEYGDVSLAEDYMNCGQGTLETAGCEWGQRHGYQCTTGYGSGSNRVRWGSKY